MTEVVRLDSIAEVRLGRQRSPKDHDGPHMRPYVRAANVGWGGWKLDDVKRMNFTDKEMLAYALKPGDLLVGEASGSANEVGKPAIWNGEIKDCAFQNTLIRVRPRTSVVEPRYLLNYFKFLAGTGKFAERSRGVGIHHLGTEALASWHVPLPPIEEQRRIAAVLDKADDLRAMRCAALAHLDSLSQSIFADMFGAPSSWPSGWDTKPLIDLVDPARPISYGILMPGPSLEEGVKYVRVVDMKDGGIDHRGLRKTSPEISAAYKRSVLRAGDLLMSIRGHVGRLAVVPVEAHGANITQDSARLAVLGADSRYICEYLRTAPVQQWMVRHTKGVAVRGLNLTDLKRLPVPLPPRSMQTRFAEIIGSIDSLRQTNVSALQSASYMCASLKQSTFSGAL